MAGALRDVPRHPEVRQSLVSKESGTPQRDRRCSAVYPDSYQGIARRTRQQTTNSKQMTEKRKYLFIFSFSICYLLLAVNCFLLFNTSPPLQAMLNRYIQCLKIY